MPERPDRPGTVIARWGATVAVAAMVVAAATTATDPAQAPPRNPAQEARITGQQELPVRHRERKEPTARKVQRRQGKARAASAGRDNGWRTWTASWYGEESGPVTASGEPFRPAGRTAAHRTLPFGTILEVCREGRCIRVRVNDRGPYVEGRDLDLARGAAEALGMIEAGVAPVRVRIVRLAAGSEG